MNWTLMAPALQVEAQEEDLAYSIDGWSGTWN
jgi:hypothetical protein